MQPVDFEATTLVPGFIGSALALSYLKDLTRTQSLVALAMGVSMAYYGTPLCMRWLGASWSGLDGGIGFFLGLFAMALVPAALGAIANLKNLKTPWNKE